MLEERIKCQISNGDWVFLRDGVTMKELKASEAIWCIERLVKCGQVLINFPFFGAILFIDFPQSLQTMDLKRVTLFTWSQPIAFITIVF